MPAKRRPPSADDAAHGSKAPKAVKKEKDAPCVAAVHSETPKEDLNRFTWKLRSAPSWVKAYYDENLKYAKAKEGSAKVEFVRQILENDDYNSSFYERMKTVRFTDAAQDHIEWISWTTLTTKEGDQLARAMLAQGTITRRHHPKLKKDDPATLALPEEERYQYHYVSEIETKTSSTELTTTKTADPADETVPDAAKSGPGFAAGGKTAEEREKDDLKEREKLLIAKMSSAKKEHNKCQSTLIDTNAKLNSYKGNEYSCDVPTPRIYSTNQNVFNISKNIKAFSMF